MTIRCAICGETHDDLSGWGFLAPTYHDGLGEERDRRGILESELCVIDAEHFFAQGVLEIPVIGAPDPFTWNLWVSLSQRSFTIFRQTLHDATRSHVEPLVGWLSNQVPFYPDTLHVKARLCLRDDFLRPLIELEPTEHPLAVAQREGYSPNEARRLMERLLHEGSDLTSEDH